MKSVVVKHAWRYITVMGAWLGLGLLPATVTGDILLRTTFEKHEGTIEDQGWTRSSQEDGFVKKEWEDQTTEFQKQAHGEWSLYAYDPDDQSYANATHAFPSGISSGDEYMVEFYFWIPASLYEGTAPDYLIRAYYPTTSGGVSADVVINLEGDTTAGGEQEWSVWVEDSLGDHACLEPGASFFDRWHKFQVHKYQVGTRDSINVYVDGEKYGPFKPRSCSTPPDSFLVGTDNVLVDGQAFWDDFIVTTVPDGEHPRVAFESVKGLLMEALSIDWNTGRHRHSLLNQYFTQGDAEALIGLSVMYNNHFESLSGYERMSIQNALIVRTEQLKLAVKYQDLPGDQNQLLEKTIILTSDVLGDSETLSYLTEK